MSVHLLLQSPMEIDNVIRETVSNDFWWAQPLATVLAAMGVIGAATIAFKSQNASRCQQQNHHQALLSDAKADREAQLKSNEASLESQRDEWQARLRHEGRRERLVRAIDNYSEIRSRMFAFEVAETVHESQEKNLPDAERKQSRARRAMTTLILGDHAGDKLFDTVARTTIIGSREVETEINQWVGFSIQGRPLKELQEQRDKATNAMATHIESLEKDV